MQQDREYPPGFSQVAAFIAKDPDHTTTIYRRFDRLSARNLLYLQARLQKLEALQDAIDNEDLVNPTIDAVKAASSLEDLERLSPTNRREHRRLEIAEQIEATIKGYHEALLLHSGVLALKPPAKRTLSAYKKWFRPASDIPKLRGHSSHILDDDDDLVALRVPAAQDRLTRLLLSHVPWIFMPNVVDEDVAHISEQRVARFVAVLNAALAIALLIGAIVSLNYIQSQDWQICGIALFTATFATCVGLLTTAGQTEVFAATAAYAAVLVVFISGRSTSSGNGNTR